MIRNYRLWTTIIAIIALVAFVGPGASPALAKAHHHHSGQQMLGNKIKQNGEHVIDKKGEHTVSAKVTNGKIAERWVNWDSLALRQPSETVNVGAV